MPYDLRQWPHTVYPGELSDFPEAQPEIDVALAALRDQGPQPTGFNVKNLGKAKNYLWQLSLKVEKRQIRILYSPYKAAIVLFHIHKKSSPQEQQRAYSKAMTRKSQAETVMRDSGNTHAKLTTVC
jgi:hypothetical protein